MPWERPTLKQLFERISRDFSGRLLDGGEVLSRSVLTVFSKIWAGACHHMHDMLAWLFLQVFADTAEGAYLARWARVWNIFRKPAAAAVGSVSFSGADGAIIPAGTLMQHQAGGLQYAARADGEASGETSGGSISVLVRAVERGAAGNLPAGAALTLTAPIAGVRSDGLVDADGISGGADEETEESLRQRFLARLRQPPRGGSKADYEAWALEVPGVTRAWCYPMGLGLGTVALMFVTDNAPGGPIPTPEMVARVQAHIEPLRPAAVRDWQVFAPEPMPITIRLSLRPDTESVRLAVRAELGDLLAREAAPETVLFRSHISEAVSLAPGELDHTLYAPAANIEIPAGYFPVLGDIIFEEAE